MLFRAKSDYNKIVMGLLSFTPNCETTSEIMEEIEWYHEDEKRSLYLFKENRQADYIGLLGVELSEENILIVRACAINPSYLNEGYKLEMLDELQALYPDYKISSTLQTKDLVSKWQVQRHNRDA